MWNLYCSGGHPQHFKVTEIDTEFPYDRQQIDRGSGMELQIQKEVIYLCYIYIHGFNASQCLVGCPDDALEMYLYTAVWKEAPGCIPDNVEGCCKFVLIGNPGTVLSVGDITPQGIHA